LIALHVAAASPIALASSQLDPAIVEREKAVLADKNAGKPPHVIEKIVESGLKTYYKEVCLLDQVSIHAEHANKTIAQVVKDAEKTAAAPVTLKSFVRYSLGEGIEKQETDFAAEVAAAAGGQA
jgi:elongation factor Ts